MLHVFIYHTIDTTDLVHPSPAPHFKTFKVLLIYFPKCPSFSTKRAFSLCWWNELSYPNMQ